MNSLGLDDNQLNLIKNVFSQYKNIEKAVVFGSRAKGNFKQYSDIDLALFGDLTSLGAEGVKLALEELPLIYKFDVLAYGELKNPKLKEHIDKVGVEIYSKPDDKWKKVKLGEFAPLVYGKSLPENSRNNGSVPIYGSNGIIGYNDKCYVNNAGIIVGRKGTIGTVHISKERFWPIDTTFYIEDEPRKRDLRFAYYLLKTTKFENSDSAVPGLNRNNAHAKILNIPPLSEQRAIADVLGALDDKIEANNRQNKTLEAMAQALFKSWFVDFEPVKAKTEEKQPEGLSPEIADLFPSSFVDSSLGRIPESWEVKQLKNIGEIICGKTPSTDEPENYGDDVPFITIPDMHGKIFSNVTLKMLSAKGANTQKNKTLPPFSISVSCIATPGLVTINPVISQTNQQINSLIPTNNDLTFYYFHCMKMVAGQIKSNGSGGSVFSNLNKTEFEKIKILKANDKISKYYNAIIQPYFQKILDNSKQSQTLAAIRDGLLPGIIGGKHNAI